MKKITLAAFFILCAVVAFAQDLSVSGEVKTGLLWQKTEDQLQHQRAYTEAGSKDDAGTGAGRFRINVDYFVPSINIGFKFRLNWQDWQDSRAESVPNWSYAFGYGKFFDEQLIVSIGKLGASPWGTGGPEMWKEVEAVDVTGGIRLEYEPRFVPGLNVGFVLNGFNASTDVWPGQKDITFLHMLQESVIGASYTHDLFHARAAFRFDSEADGPRDGALTGKEGGELVYRLEERVLRNFVPDFSIWAMGYITGIGADEHNKGKLKTENWLFVEYAPALFTAQMRFGYDVSEGLHKLYAKPSFYLNLLDRLIRVGASFEYKQDFGIHKTHPGSPYHTIEVRPLLQINLNPNAYAAFEYSFLQTYVQDNNGEYALHGLEPFVRKQWVNLRVGMKF